VGGGDEDFISGAFTYISVMRMVEAGLDDSPAPVDEVLQFATQLSAL
jgi:hypothetical protein